MQPQFPASRNNDGIHVYETTELYGEKGRFRVLQFSGDAVQGALDLEQPRRVVFEYPRAMIHLMECNEPYFQDVFLIGHGIGTIAGHFAEKRFKVAEVNAAVVNYSRTHFGYNLDNVIIGDGRSLLENEQDGHYDYILLDAFTSAGTPPHFISSEFFRLTRTKHHPRGSLLMNLMGKSENDRLMNAIHTTLSEQYPYVAAFALPAEGSADIRNIIMMGSGKPVRYQARQMAGFVRITPGQGHVIRD